MKVTRRRALFYQRRSSNLYRLFILAILLLAAIWIATRLDTGAIRNPFAPTPTATRTVNSWALEGEARFDAGDLNAAIAAYQQATLVAPDDGQIWAELARIQTYSSRLLTSDEDRQARLAEALISSNQAVAVAPDDSNTHAIRALALDWYATGPLADEPQQRLIEAEQEALKALSLSQTNALAFAFYAEILIDQLKWNQAEQYIQQALQNGPDLMDVHRVYAYWLESTSNYRQAIEEYQKALASNPNLTFLYISIGQNYRTLAFLSTIPSQQNGLYELAIENFAKAANLNKQLKINDPLPYVALAKTYAQKGDFLAASLNAQKAVDLDPSNPDLYGQLGNVYKRGRNYETAIIALKCAVQGCTAEESCKARAGCASGDSGITVAGLALSPGSATYYLDYGSVLAAFSPRYPNYCVDAVDVLTQLMDTYGNDPIIARNAQDGLSICASVAESQLLTPTPAATQMALPTP